jgi:NADPH:quinone reductase
MFRTDWPGRSLIHQHGPAETFSFEDVDVPDPVDNEVLVRNTVIGLNFVDVCYRRGTFPVPSFPAIIGDEAAGIVEAVGRNVTSVKVGDRVAYADAFGAYTTARLYPADRLTIIPEGISDNQAASSFLKALTARYLVKEVVPLKPGDTVLYHAAAGGVGLIFVQWATSLGIRVIGTVSTKEEARLALEAGCVAVINYNT